MTMQLSQLSDIYFHCIFFCYCVYMLILHHNRFSIRDYTPHDRESDLEFRLKDSYIST